MSIRELLGHDDIEIVTAGTGDEALATLREEPCDCVVLDLRLPDMSGFEVLEQMRDDDAACATLPVVVFTGRELSAEEDAQLHTMARSIVVKGVESPERLLDETALFLHRVDHRPARREAAHARAAATAPTRIWSAARCCWSTTTRATSSRLASVLERRGMNVLTATTGSEAIELLEKTPDIAIVLMDIMMPEMDGYQTMRADPQEPRVPRACRSSR